MLARSFSSASITAFWFCIQADIPFPVLGTCWRGFSQVSPNILSPCGQCQPSRAAWAGSPCFSAPSLTILGLLTHSHKRQIWHKLLWKGWARMGPNSFCCQCGGWEGCPQPWALQEHKMSDFNQHQALALMRMLACTLKSLNSSAFGVLCCQGQLLSLCIVLLCDPTHKLFLSTPQWIADRNKPNFMSVWRAYAQGLHAHPMLSISSPVRAPVPLHTPTALSTLQ